MLDLARLQRVRLHRKPWAQILVAELFLRPSYRFPHRTEIELVGYERIPRDRPVVYAMNHTDRYNYWPFQYALHRRRHPRYVVTWVKGKYYEHPLVGWFMDRTNNVPLPSRGYVLTTAFREAVRRLPTEAEYRILRDVADGVASGTTTGAPTPSEDLRRFLDEQGRGASPDAGLLPVFEARFERMIEEVLRLTREAITTYGCNLLVFPQGTRSKRLLAGHTGLAQVTQRLGVAILPVGCNGCDRVYPSASPWARGGRVVYRIGTPLEPDGPELGAHRVTEEYVPLTRDATRRFGARFRAITDVVTARIDALLDPEYRMAPEAPTSGGSQGVARFV